MAKQKKKVKKRKPQLSKKDKRLFKLVNFGAMVILGALCFINIGYFIPFLEKSIISEDDIYSHIRYNAFTLIMVFSPLVITFIGLFNYDYSKNLRLSFKEYYSGKNQQANKQIKTAIIVSLCFVVLWGAMIPFMLKTYDSADSKQLVKHYIAKQDETVMRFDNVRSIRVYVGMSVGNRGSTTQYTAICEITDNKNTVYSFSERSFVDRIIGMDEFLSQFDKSIITVDKKFSNKISYINKDYDEAFHRIFD